MASCYGVEDQGGAIQNVRSMYGPVCARLTHYHVVFHVPLHVFLHVALHVRTT